MHIPEGFACRGRHEGGYIEPVKAVMTKGDRPLADLRPDAPRYGLQAEPMLVACENFDGPIGVFFRFLDNGVRELFLNAASSSGVADFGFFGRGAWIDQPSAFSASQPRCGQTFSSPSSCAIQTAIFGLVHTPPSLGGSRKRSRSLSSSSGLKSSPTFRCVAVDHRASPAPRRCSGRRAVRSSAPRTRSSARPRRHRGLWPAARSSGNAARGAHPNSTHNAPANHRCSNARLSSP